MLKRPQKVETAKLQPSELKFRKLSLRVLGLSGLGTLYVLEQLTQ